MADDPLPSVEELLARAEEDPRLPELPLRAEELLDLDPEELGRLADEAWAAAPQWFREARTCPVCGGRMAGQASQRTCSHRCRQRLYRDRIRASRLGG